MNNHKADIPPKGVRLFLIITSLIKTKDINTGLITKEENWDRTISLLDIKNKIKKLLNLY